MLIGMASSGVHSNGFSLVRKVFEKEMTKEGLAAYYDELGGTLGDVLIAPTRIYVKALKAVKQWKFSPAHLGGYPVAQKATKEFRFVK